MNEDEEKIDLTCPRCNGTMEINEEKTELNCPYCRHKIILKQKESAEELAEKERKISYAKVEGERLAEEKAERREKRRRTKSLLITYLVIFSIFFLIVYGAFSLRKEIDDPFEYVDIIFSGDDGDGQAKIVPKENSISSEITYSLSKQYYLYNNEKIVISAQSSVYKFKNKKKEIQVTGLNSYLASIDELTSEMKAEIQKKTYNTQKENIENKSYKREIISLEHYKFYLTINADKTNYLDDVYLLKLKGKTETIYDRYLVMRYENVMIINREENRFKYDHNFRKGQVIDAGSDVWGKDYIGAMTGFKTLDDVESFIKNNSNTGVKVLEE